MKWIHLIVPYRRDRYRLAGENADLMTATSPTPAGLTWSGVTARRMARHAPAEPAADLSPAGVAGLLRGVGPVTVGAHA